MRILRLNVGIVAVAVLAAGCTIPGLDPFAVSEPKKLAAVQDACQLLKPEQLQTLNAGEAKPGRSLWGQSSCSWEGVRKNAIDLSPDTVEGDGIRTVAGNSTPDGKPNHEINGYPAVRVGDGSVSCTVHVATSEKDAFLVSFTPSSVDDEKPEFSDTCRVVDNIAAMVLSNLPPE